MQQLHNTHQQYLRRMAHDLRPAVQIGKNGLTDQIHTTIDHELNAHELIKIKFMDFKDEKRELTEELAEAKSAHPTQDVQALARWLVRREKLTAFQAQQIAQAEPQRAVQADLKEIPAHHAGAIAVESHKVQRVQPPN